MIRDVNCFLGNGSFTLCTAGRKREGDDSLLNWIYKLFSYRLLYQHLGQMETDNGARGLSLGEGFILFMR